MTILSEEAFQFNDRMRIAALPLAIFIGLLSLLGLIGNCVVIFVYNGKYPKCNFKYFVLVLAGIDLGSCFILMPIEIYTLMHWFVFEHSWLCKTKSFLNVFTISASSSTLLLIAIDRFRKVCRPHGKQIQPSLAVKLTVVVLTISTIPAVSDTIFWGIHTHDYRPHGMNLTVKMCEKDDKFKDTIWPQLHVIILYAGLNICVMLTTLVLYGIIASKLFCVNSFPSITAPSILVTSTKSEDSGVSSPRTPGTNTIFNFPDAGIESGLSESEDVDLHASVSLTDSKGDITDDDAVKEPEVGVVTELSVNGKGEELEMVPLRNKNLQPSREKKQLRISIEIATDSDNRNSLQIPGLELRKPPRSPRSPRIFPSQKEETKQKEAQAQRYTRRRSTIASMTGRSSTRLRRKTLIMFILTAIFVGTTLLYFCLIASLAEAGHFVASLSMAERAVLFFFLRLYFVNSVINPVLYGFLDPRFRRALWNMGIRVKFMAGSLKKNIGHSIRRSTSGRISHDAVTVAHRTHPRPILKSRSSRSTISD
ncbi:Neuropeptide Y receptor [Mactra antiquata]